MSVHIRVLKTFIAAAREGHFGRAAERVHLSQPALSRQIGSLEDEVGVELFERAGRGVELTRAGADFLVFAERCVREYESGVAAARRTATGFGGTLKVGFVSPAIYANVVPVLISRFREEAPDVEVTLHELSSRPQAEALETGDLDVAFLHPPVPGIDLELHTLFRQRFVAALPAKHPLAGESTIAASQLAQEPFIIFPRHRGPGLYDRIITACQTSGFSPRVVQEATRMQTIVSLVAAGIGVAIVPHSITKMGQSGVAYCELSDVREEGTLAAAWLPANINPVLGLFLDVVRNFTAEQPVTPP